KALSYRMLPCTQRYNFIAMTHAPGIDLRQALRAGCRWRRSLFGTASGLLRPTLADSANVFGTQCIALRAAPKPTRSGAEADSNEGRSSPEAVPKRSRSGVEQPSKPTRREMERQEKMAVRAAVSAGYRPAIN